MIITVARFFMNAHFITPEGPSRQKLDADPAKATPGSQADNAKVDELKSAPPNAPKYEGDEELYEDPIYFDQALRDVILMVRVRYAECDMRLSSCRVAPFS